jgi:Icc-related predicted phosphoesterase
VKGLPGALLATILASCAGSSPPQPFSGKLPSFPAGHFAVIGDTQGTTLLGRALQNENNDPERELLLPKLASRKPAFVVMLGDLVSFGSSNDAWSELEAHARDLRQNRIPVLAVLGNHEYLLDAKSGRRHFFDRFPEQDGAQWFERTYGPLGLVFLNSNTGSLSDAQRDTQLAWYTAALSRMEVDPAVHGILVFMHHPPYTNNSLVGDDDYAQRHFVPPLMSASHAMGVVTGHAHGYERFEIGGKTFVVSAGGGGPRFPVLTGDKRRHSEEKYSVPGRRHFNFMELSFRHESLHALVVGLPKDKKEFCRMDEFDFKWPVPIPNEITLADDAATLDTLPACD